MLALSEQGLAAAHAMAREAMTWGGPGASGVALLAVAAACVAGSSAALAADAIGVSDDGVTFSPGLDRPLFDAAVRWVPGDSRRETFFVRNQGPSGASMSIEARRAADDGRLADDIVLRARADGGGWVELRNGVAPTRLTDEAIERGGVVRVDVKATFEPGSRNPSQVERLALDVSVTLADSAASGNGAAGGDGSGGPLAPADVGATLPETGAGSARGLVLLGLAAVVVGAGALTAQSRTETRTR